MHNLILVTGANGFVGKGVCKCFYANGLPFLATARTPSEEQVRWDIQYLDLTTTESLRKVSTFPIDCIIHCAAELPRHSTLEASIKAADANKIIDDTVFSLAKELHARLIYFSGTSVYGFDKNDIIDESHSIPKGLSPYIEQKYLSEQKALTMMPNSVVLRVSAPYGPGQSSNTVLKIFIKKALKSEVITYHGSGARQQDFTHIKDIAEAVLKCVYNDNAKGIYNIASGKPISMKSLAKLIVSITPHCQSKVIASGSTDSQESYRALFNIEKAKKELGWKSKISLEQGIEEWIKYLQK